MLAQGHSAGGDGATTGTLSAPLSSLDLYAPCLLRARPGPRLGPRGTTWPFLRGSQWSGVPLVFLRLRSGPQVVPSGVGSHWSERGSGIRE